MQEDELPARKRKPRRDRGGGYDETSDEDTGGGVPYYESIKDLKYEMGRKAFKVASYPMSNKRDAVNWWRKVGAGKSYFAILKRPNKRTGTDYYYVVDIDPGRKRAGSNKKVNRYESHRAEQIYQKYVQNSGEDS